MGARLNSSGQALLKFQPIRPDKGSYDSGSVTVDEMLAQATGSITTAQFNSLNVAAGNFTIDSSGHIVTGGTTPGIVAGAGAGTNPTVAVTGNDVCGYLTITTGSSPSGNADVATITFANSFKTAPRAVFLTPINSTATLAVTANKIYASQTNITANGWVLSNNSSTGLTGTSTYVWGYLVLG